MRDLRADELERLRADAEERHLQETTDETFEVMSLPRRGASAIVVDLRRIEL
jgi:hypothetical protein